MIKVSILLDLWGFETTFKLNARNVRWKVDDTKISYLFLYIKFWRFLNESGDDPKIIPLTITHKYEKIEGGLKSPFYSSTARLFRLLRGFEATSADTWNPYVCNAFI
jgi:hypothetical protein